MGLRLGEIRGFDILAAKSSGFSNTINFANPKFVENIPRRETILSCKPFKPECEFCKEKIGLLNDDVFIKSDNSQKLLK